MKVLDRGDKNERLKRTAYTISLVLKYSTGGRDRVIFVNDHDTAFVMLVRH